MTTEDFDLQAIQSVLQLLFSTSSVEETMNIVMQHHELLDEKMDMILNRMTNVLQF